VERAIGEVGHKIRSKKAPFANLANIIYEREMVKILLLLYPSLYSSPTGLSDTSGSMCTPHNEIKIPKKEWKNSQELQSYLNAICIWLGIDFDSELEIRRWGKIRLPKGILLRSRLSETRGKMPSRSARYFEAQRDGDTKPVFGEALAFFEVLETKQLLVIYYPVNNCHQMLKKWRGVWSDKMEVLSTAAIHSLVGIWTYESNVYILRKHPGLAFLSEEEVGKESGNEEVEEEE